MSYNMSKEDSDKAILEALAEVEKGLQLADMVINGIESYLKNAKLNDTQTKILNQQVSEARSYRTDLVNYKTKLNGFVVNINTIATLLAMSVDITTTNEQLLIINQKAKSTLGVK